MIILATVLTALSFLPSAKASTSIDYETSCRMKAKEIASDTYRTCITENKSAQIDRIKQGYKEELKALKDKYERQLVKLNPRANTARKAVPKRVQSIDPSPTDDSVMDIPEPIPVDNSNL